MNANNAIGKSFVDIDAILTPEEKAEVAKLWSQGFNKNWSGIDLLLRNNLIECIQPRKMIADDGYKSTRHMLCTRNFFFAKRLAALRGLKMDVKKPRGNPWYQQRGIILVWDVVANDWRMVNLKNANEWRILDFLPFQTEKQFVQVANLWTTHMKKVKPYGAGWKSYVNFLRKGV